MRSSPNVESARWRPPPLVSFIGQVLVLLIAGVAIAWFVQGWALLPCGFVLGAALTTSWFQFRVRAPLAVTEQACRLIESGDLSQTVPEVGPRRLRSVTRVINDMAADFQEVMLLFAHLVRSARYSARLLQAHVLAAGAGDERDRWLAGKIISDIHDMQEMLQDFRYFRVRIEDSAIIDTGIEKDFEDAGSPENSENPEKSETPETPEIPAGSGRGEER